MTMMTTGVKTNMHNTLSENLLGVMRCGALMIAFLLLGSAGSNAVAQGAPSVNSGGQGTTAPPPKPAVATEQAIYLVRSVLSTLNDANRSGNYTVLRDLAAPDFQAKNTAADLSQIFSDLRRRNFDLFAVAILAPQFTITPALDATGKLRLAGFFATRPLQIKFDLTFQSVGGQWRLFAISVATPEAPATQSELIRPHQPRVAGPWFASGGLSGAVGWRW